jgi:NAD(P)-dependent dehydrogenase (short-subunit alcohol dehydrogenase family)
VAIVTGAAQGIGRKIAEGLAGEGARVVVADVQAAEDVAAGLDGLAVACDVSDEQACERMARAAMDAFGRIDVLVNNASTLGATPMPELADYRRDALRDAFVVNAVAPVHLIQLVLPAMKARRAGVIINVTSDAAVEAYPTWGGYGASKAALEHLSRVLAAELEGSGVRLYVVDPGDMNTQMHRDAEPGVDLSDLPTPDVPAPAFLQLLGDPRPFARIRAMDLVAEGSREVEHAGA